MAKKGKNSAAGLQEASAPDEANLLDSAASTSTSETKVETDVEKTEVAAEVTLRADTITSPIVHVIGGDLVEEGEDDEDGEYDPGAPDPSVRADMSLDPSATVAAALLSIGKLYNQAGVISAALSKHLSATAGKPELHSFLQRMQIALGELRHAVYQVEASSSEELTRAIAEAVA